MDATGAHGIFQCLLVAEGRMSPMEVESSAVGPPFFKNGAWGKQRD